MPVREPDKRLLRSLAEAGIITREVAREVAAQCADSGGKVLERLVTGGALTEDEALQALELEFQIPYVRLENAFLDPEAVRLVPQEIATRHRVIAMARRDGDLILAMADPLNVMVCDEVQRITGLHVQCVMARAEEIESAIKRHYHVEASLETAMEGIGQHVAEIEADEASHPDEIRSQDLSHDSPVARLVDGMIERALRQHASDIHIEPGLADGVVRLRVDGLLRDLLTISMKVYPAVVSRLKVQCNMDIAERRVPQDGRFAVSLQGRQIDFRVSTMPTVMGEKTVLRILDKSKAQVSLDDMGFPTHDRQRLEEAIAQPHGMFIITGPTGSGKTTTLYAILQKLNDVGVNIITCEDPVEYQLDRVNQVQLNTRAGLTFGSFLRSALRQDPDVIMVGEMRDGETAELGVRAALTGHLVLSTLHTNDAVSVATRLLDMAIEPYLVSSTLVGALSQRLVRRICHNCKATIHVPAAELKRDFPRLGLEEDMVVHRGQGCRVCDNSGYSGRLAVFELFIPDAQTQRLICDRADAGAIQRAARAAGMTTLLDAVVGRVRSGDTTLEEAARITSA